ncbi:MAG: heavy-metal-associated domain-containing protein [Flavobacteriales bacterium]|nr:heavy-metal-associated domain-containing protein [Flavobacteriales bacterium]
MSEKTTIIVEGMSCGHCSNAVKNLIEEVEGVESAEVNLATKQASVSFDPNATTTRAIIDNINSSETYKATEK